MCYYDVRVLSDLDAEKASQWLVLVGHGRDQASLDLVMEVLGYLDFGS